MAFFVSTFANKLDSKGRVSVPVSFRSALAGQSFGGIVAYRSIKFDALEAGGIDSLEELSARLDALPEFSEERDALASILPDCQLLPFDGEGRIILPRLLLDHAGITTTAAFVGYGRTFQIWEPERFNRHQEEMRQHARQRGFTLPPRNSAPGSGVRP